MSRHPAIRVAYTTSSPASSLAALSGDYERQGAAGEPEPQEIVAALHRQIAAKSPEHAALVAAYEARQQAGIDAVKRAGREAWRIHHGQEHEQEAAP